MIIAANYYKSKADTIFYYIRFGNVMGSIGSLIPFIENQIKYDLSISLTNREMTSYIIIIEKQFN